MSKDSGRTEAYRPYWTLPVGEILVKWAKEESRTIPSLIQDLVVEAISHRIETKKRSDLKQRIINGEEKV